VFVARFVILMIALWAALPAGAAAPVTGRAQDLRYTREELNLATGEDFRAYLQALASERLLEGRSAGARRIERIFRRLLPAARRLDPAGAARRWRVVVTKAEHGALFAMPDGKIFVSARWVAEHRLSDQELALAIAHEMAHVVADHLLERVSAIAALRPLARLGVPDVLRMAREEWTVLREIEPLMRTHEREADRIGIAIAHAAGVSLAKAITLFDKMARAEETRDGISLVNSHDSARQRKANLTGWMRAHEFLLASAT
jgi:Zn-dependent protease with chaperone function